MIRRKCLVFFKLVIRLIGLILIGLIFDTCSLSSRLDTKKYPIIADPIIPKEVIIPAGYKIFNIYNKNQPIDFNNDGLNDFIFSFGKEKVNIGDTSYIVFYKMNKDSTFSFF